MSTDSPTIALGATPGFVVQLDRFNGPLDLLLHLLREQQIEIADIPIAQIADQFLGVIHELGLNQAADYLDMAEPSGAAQGADAAAAALRGRGLGGSARRAGAPAAGIPADQGDRPLAAAAGRPPGAPVCARVPASAAELPPPPLELSLVDLLEAVDRVVNGIPTPVLHRVVARPLNVEGATLRIEALLREASEISFREALGARPTIVDVLSTLLALLELARRGLLRVAQGAPFAAMVIRRESPLPAD
jgi:segregation and condensation protein A